MAKKKTTKKAPIKEYFFYGLRLYPYKMVSSSLFPKRWFTADRHFLDKEHVAEYPVGLLPRRSSCILVVGDKINGGFGIFYGDSTESIELYTRTSRSFATKEELIMMGFTEKEIEKYDHYIEGREPLENEDEENENNAYEDTDSVSR